MSSSAERPIPLEINLLNLKDELNIRSSADRESEVFDPLRRQWCILTPEEFVRQLLILWMMDQGVGSGRISIERSLNKAAGRERYDLLVLDKQAAPWLLAECKSFRVNLGQSAFQQSSRYNRQLKVPYQMITNGRATYLSKIDYEDHSFTFLSAFPSLDD